MAKVQRMEKEVEEEEESVVEEVEEEISERKMKLTSLCCVIVHGL